MQITEKKLKEILETFNNIEALNMLKTTYSTISYYRRKYKIQSPQRSGRPSTLKITKE